MLAKVRKQYLEQEIHVGCKNQTKDAELTLEAISNGVGDYLVINAYEFAVSDHEEIDEMCKILHRFMDDYCDKED